MSEQGNNNWRLCTNLHCSPLRNCIRQKMNGQWHPFVCPLIFIGTLMSRAIKLNSGLKCFSSPQIEGERRTWAIKVSVFRLHFSSAITSISHHILSVRPPVHPSVDPSGSQSVSQPASQSITRIVFVCVSFSIPINLFGIFSCQFFPFPHPFFFACKRFLFASIDLCCESETKSFSVACCIFK